MTSAMNENEKKKRQENFIKFCKQQNDNAGRSITIGDKNDSVHENSTRVQKYVGRKGKNRQKR